MPAFQHAPSEDEQEEIDDRIVLAQQADQIIRGDEDEDN